MGQDAKNLKPQAASKFQQNRKSELPEHEHKHEGKNLNPEPLT
jgi:hypothetical protein